MAGSMDKLQKSLGLADVFCISSGAMISSGIFILPGIAYAKIGPSVFLAYLLAGLCALFGTLATIELATAMPLAGGVYYYTGRSLGPLAGTVSGLLNWSAIALKSAFAIFGMSAVLQGFFGFNPLASGVILTLIFLAVNLIGTKEASVAQIVMVVLLFAVMGAYVALGFPHFQAARFTPFFFGENTAYSLFAEAAFVFVAFGGLLDVASISEEVRNPKRNLPLGMIAATVAVMVIYVLTLIVTVGELDGSQLSGSLTPLADAARLHFGKLGFGVVTFGAVMAFVTTANAGVMAAARFPFAMGRDKLIPEFFSRTCGKKKMPLPALLLTGGAMVAVQFLDIEKMVTVASTVIMLSFILTNLAVMILRESGIQNYQPSFRVPFYPWTPILSMIVFALLISELGMGSVKMSFLFLVAGVALYFIFGRRINHEYALAHLIRRLTRGRVAPGRELESELREIVLARDQIVPDDFDAAVRKARIVVVEEAGRTFESVARQLYPEYADRFLEREKVSSTVLPEGFAIPHLQIPGEEHFELAVVKSPQGVSFGAKAPSVKAMFFLLCSSDRRNMHLKALAAIARITQAQNFPARWRKAQTAENIRDLLLLSKRKRF